MARPTKEQEYRNKLKRYHKASIDKKLELYEELNDEIHHIFGEMIKMAKQNDASNGYYKALNDLFKIWREFPAEIEQSIDFLESKESPKNKKNNDDEEPEAGTKEYGELVSLNL